MWVLYSELWRDLRPGDRVRIVDEWVSAPSHTPRWNISGGMDRYLGNVMTVDYVYDHPDESYYDMREDHGAWTWFREMIDSVYIPDATPLDDVSAWQTPSLCNLFD